MGIQPIDLQTLFSQLEKVAKDQSVHKEGLQIQQSLQGMQIQKKTEERAQSINESQDIGKGTEQIKDQTARKQPDWEASGQEGDTDGEAEEKEDPSVIRDPKLGKIIDISG
jgi:hypothetical protein